MGGAHIVLAEHFEHRRARLPRDDRQRDRAEDDGGEDQMAQGRDEGGPVADQSSASMVMKPVIGLEEEGERDAPRNRRPSEDSRRRR